MKKVKFSAQIHLRQQRAEGSGLHPRPEPARLGLAPHLGKGEGNHEGNDSISKCQVQQGH